MTRGRPRTCDEAETQRIICDEYEPEPVRL